MLLTSLYSGLALLLATATAHPSAKARAVLSTNPNLQINNLMVNDSSTGNTILSFDVQNPEPLAAQGVARCGGVWSHTKQDWPISGKSIKCDNSQTMTWFIDSWEDAREFVVGIQDRFNDATVGDAPYNRVTTFSKFVVNATSVRYDDPDPAATPNQAATPKQAADTISGSQPPEYIIYAPVYAVSAR